MPRSIRRTTTERASARWRTSRDCSRTPAHRGDASVQLHGARARADYFLVPKIVDHFVRRAPRINLGNLDLFRDFSDLRRVVEVYARLVSRPVDHAVVNICSGRPIHLASIIGLLQEISGHSIEVVKDPGLVRPGEPRVIEGSVTRLQSMLGDLPNPDFRDTLRSMYEAGASST